MHHAKLDTLRVRKKWRTIDDQGVFSETFLDETTNTAEVIRLEVREAPGESASVGTSSFAPLLEVGLCVDELNNKSNNE